MTQGQITLFFLAILGVIAGAMVVHSMIDKRRIKKSISRLLSEVSGEVIQGNPLIYPRFHGTLSGRTLEVFFTVVKVGRQHILYFILSVGAKITCDLLLIKKEAYKPASTPSGPSGPSTPSGGLSGAAGSLLPDLDPAYHAHSKNPQGAGTVFRQAQPHLEALDRFYSIQIGPDAIVAGKPYDGEIDIAPQTLLKDIRVLEVLALSLEQCPI